ncbi:DUF5685 family protein [Dethiothermospora halolimnae]|uniref:DUF5685 family protein n=1 Tax=Dethiothermospora halolimnae TaxID=3114390 RepID=UPI003CCC4538
MFGYVKPYKSELKVREYDVFKGYYCGLCKSIGKEFNQLNRMGLNYDLTFLGLLLSSLDEKKDIVKVQGCIANPLKKKPIIDSNMYLEYTSNISIMLVYFKLLDDWKDEKSIKALVGIIPFLTSIRKAKKAYKNKYCHIKKQLDHLSELENNKCDIIDKSADAFGKLMEELWNPPFIEDNKKKRILKWLGYNLGRWIYIIDAYNDIERDLEKSNYNPVILQYKYKEEESIENFKNRIKDNIGFSLTLTLDNIAKSFELLDIKYNRSLLENIIYMGTRHKMEQIIYKEERGHGKSIQSIRR